MLMYDQTVSFSPRTIGAENAGGTGFHVCYVMFSLLLSPTPPIQCYRGISINTYHFVIAPEKYRKKKLLILIYHQ